LEKVKAVVDPQVQVLSDKNLELEAKITSLEVEAEKISELEIKTNQLLAEVDKNASLRQRVHELENAQRMKKTSVSPRKIATKKKNVKAVSKKTGKRK